MEDFSTKSIIQENGLKVLFNGESINCSLEKYNNPMEFIV